MILPPPHSDGLRRYDCDVEKVEDPTRCAVEVTEYGRGRDEFTHQCYRSRTHNLFCAEHAGAEARGEPVESGFPPKIHPKEKPVSLKEEDEKAKYVIDYYRLAVTVAMNAVELEKHPCEESRKRYARAVAAWRRFTEPNTPQRGRRKAARLKRRNT